MSTEAGCNVNRGGAMSTDGRGEMSTEEVKCQQRGRKVNRGGEMSMEGVKCQQRGQNVNGEGEMSMEGVKCQQMG